MASFNTSVLQRFEAIQQALVAHKAGGVGMPSAMKGSERETFLRDFLQEVFPAHRRFSSGVITDSTDQLSGQIDIAIEFGNLPSFPMPAAKEIEKTTAKVKKLRRNWNHVMTIGSGSPEKIPVVAVGYEGFQTIDGLNRRLEQTEASSRPDAALVISSGVFSGYGLKASGAPGLYALCGAIASELDRLCIARPNFFTYMKPDPEVPGGID